MTNFTKVTMNLTDKDVQNTFKLKEKLHSQSNADAVSAALSIAFSIIELIENKKAELFMKTSGGDVEKIIIAGLNA